MRFKIKYLKNNKVYYDIFEADSFNQLENLPNTILDIKQLDNNATLTFNFKKKIDFLPILKQLKIMLDAKLTISDAINLVAQNQKDNTIKDILYIIENSIKSSSNLESALKKYKNTIPLIVIIFLELGIKNGNITQSISSLVQILQEDYETISKIKNTLRYPIILLVSLVVAIGLIFVYVIPNFEYIFLSAKDNLPLSTIILLKFKYIVLNYYYLIFGFIIGLFYGVKYLYKLNKFYCDKIVLTKIPIVSKMVHSYIFYKLFLALLMLMESKYQFQIALQNIKKLSNNLYIEKIIEDIITDLKNGSNISEAFEKTGLFDNLIIKLLFTAQHTSNYVTILDEIVKIYKQYFQQNIKNFNSMIEPIVVFFISVVVLWLILALMSPIWDLSSVM